LCGVVLGTLVCGAGFLRAQVASSGSIELPPEGLGLVLFDGVSINQTVGYASVDFQMAHSLVTGQITGMGSVRLQDISYRERYISASGDLSGTLNFSAKPVKRGSIVTLSGAKITAKTTGSAGVDVYNGGWESYPFDFVSNPTFTFRSLTATIRDSGILLAGTVARGSLPVAASGYVQGQRIKRNVSIPYSEASFSDEISREHLVGLDVELSNLVQNARGNISGAAGSLFDGGTGTTTSGYKVAGTRSAKTGVSRLTLTGVGAMKGTSAVLNVDDYLQLKQGKGYANSLRAFGYSLSF
jgi:hypothetical protein